MEIKSCKKIFLTKGQLNTLFATLDNWIDKQEKIAFHEHYDELEVFVKSSEGTKIIGCRPDIRRSMAFEDALCFLLKTDSTIKTT